MSVEMQIAILGVLGTLGGTVLGWVLNNLSKRGKLNIFVSSWKDKFEFNNNMGCMEASTSKEQTEYYGYNLSLDLYNSCGEPKIMRDIKVLFVEDKKTLFESIPKDDTTKRISHPMVFYDDVSVVNIPAKMVVKLNLHNGFWKDKKKTDDAFELLWKVNTIYLQYTDENNKKRKVVLKREEYKDCFTEME